MTREDARRTSRRKLQVPFLGMVPKCPAAPPCSRATSAHVRRGVPIAAHALAFSNGATSGRVIVVTSSQPLEGKTTTATNLAIALALGGEKGAAGGRRPAGAQLHKTLGIDNSSGLSHLLTGRRRARAVRLTSIPNLWVMTAGQVPPTRRSCWPATA
jgi:Mrp family chromosome partitioning ATPase